MSRFQGSFRVLLIVLFVSATFVLTGCSLFGQTEVVNPPGGDTGNGLKLIFEDNFADETIGQAPSKWSSSGGANIQVVSDPDAVGGKAVQLLGHSDNARQFSVSVPVNAPVVVVDFSLRWVKNGGLSYWVDHANPSSSEHNVNLTVSDAGILSYRYTSETGGNVVEEIGALGNDWNRVRIIAHARKNQAYVFFNDFSAPALDSFPLPFRTWEDREWGDVRLTFYDTGRRDNLAETYYDDVRVWTMDEELANDYF